MTRGFVLWWIKGISRHLKPQEMCNAVVLIEPYPLAYVPDHFKTEGMCNEADVPDHFRTQKMCNEAVEEAPS